MSGVAKVLCCEIMRLFALTLLAATATASAQLTADTEAKVAAAAEKVLHDTGVPSASVGIAQNGKVVYARAFGLANVTPPKPATASMAYPIGSISKQFTATAVLLLQQEGKLSLDDKVAKYFPELTRANEVSLRNLMTMTSGYEDDLPQDYIIPALRRPTTPEQVMHEWAEKPLDFDPGAEWQYSNTNYATVALIVQKVAGVPFAQFLRQRVLAPLDLQGVFNTYTQREKLEVTGYVSNAMAAPRVLPLEAPGWYVGDGDLAMPASTLLAWDIGIMHQSLLSPASYKEFETPFVLKSGESSGYGLGVRIRMRNGHRELEHSGEVGGYVAENVVYPEDGVAIVALTNEVASSAAGDIVNAITPLVLPAAVPPAAAPDTFAPQLQAILGGLQKGQIDRGLLTPNCITYFDADTLADFQSTLAPLGTVVSATRTYSAPRGGMTFSGYRVAFSGGSAVRVSVAVKPDGKIEQLLVIGKTGNP
jgi:CubicO group peptidase (beta-lactamase class C family)